MAATPELPAVQKAIVIKQLGRDWVVEVDPAYPLPTLKPNEALVRLSHTGVCHSDLSGINGSWDRQATCRVPGHEGIGRIAAYHEDQATSREAASLLPPLGTKVGVPLIREPCGKCYACSKAAEDGEDEVYCSNTHFHGLHVDGTYEQYITVATSYLVRVPEALDDAVAAPILCGGVTAYKALKRSQARRGDWVAVAGAGGGLGLFAVQYAVAMGMRVVAIDTGAHKKAKTLALGASTFVDFRSEEDVPRRVNEITDGEGAHAVLVIAPSEVTYNQAMDYTRLHGCLVGVGLPHESVIMRVNPGVFIHRDITICGSMVGTRKDIGEALEFVTRGLVVPDISVHPMEDITSIYERMERSEVIGRAVLDLR